VPARYQTRQNPDLGGFVTLYVLPRHLPTLFHSPQPTWPYFLFQLLSRMTSFASLMALSATHTKESQRVVEDALQERRRKEAQQKKQQEEREAKEKERERKLLIKRFEDQKREQERLQRLEVERQAQQLALQRREEVQRDALRYGPKKASKLAGKHSSGSRDSPNLPSSSSSNRDAVRKLRAPDDDDDGPSGLALTREELRERKNQASLQKTFKTSKRSTTGSYSKHSNKFAGGVLNMKSSGATAELSAGQSVKERLTSLPMTLKVLGGKKKDRRSELEMFYDSKKKRSGEVLEGDEARNFDGYFTLTKKEKAKLKRAQAVSASATASGADFLVLLNYDFSI
jgi:protein SPT2